MFGLFLFLASSMNLVISFSTSFPQAQYHGYSWTTSGIEAQRTYCRCVLDLVPREVLVPHQSPSGSMLLHITIQEPRHINISSLVVIGMSNFGVEKRFFERLTMGSGRTMSCCHTALCLGGASNFRCCICQ